MSDNLSNGGRAGTFTLNKAGLAVGSTSTGISHAATNGAGLGFCIDGLIYHAADDATAAITAAAVQAVSTTCLYLICLSTAGTPSSVKGTEVLTADLTAGAAVLEWPLPLVDTCPIGVVQVATNASTTFTAGTTALDAAGITDVYLDLFSIPDRPLTAALT